MLFQESYFWFSAEKIVEFTSLFAIQAYHITDLCIKVRLEGDARVETISTLEQPFVKLSIALQYLKLPFFENRFPFFKNLTILNLRKFD